MEQEIEVIFLAFVKAQDLVKIYKNGEIEYRALNGVSFEINEGEILSILGPSGCGKSTLLNCLSGIDDPTSGKVFVDGVNLHALSDNEKTRFRALKMGFIFQFYNLIPVLTALENVELTMLAIGAENKSARRAAMEALEQIGMKDRVDYLPSQLSGGERQRVAIARALVHKPKIVWADEPTGALDSKTGSEIMELIKHLNEEFNQTFVIVTHDDRVASYSERILHMDSGKIISIEKRQG
ncbi:MAG: putative transport system ATP-binding protein [Kosmotoga sp.]|nr:putative transport system ATP-binding protein [Kosmotoga sp.]MDK2953812.1 putative transport system ATP-binding protein [Kosmotoga sp.]